MGFDREVLLRSGIEDAGAFAAVSSGDNSNIISARVARETFGCARWWPHLRRQAGGGLRAAGDPHRGDRAVDDRPAAERARRGRRDRPLAGSDRDRRRRRGGAARGVGGPTGHRPRGGHRRPGRVRDPVRDRHPADPRPSSRPATRCTSRRCPATPPRSVRPRLPPTEPPDGSRDPGGVMKVAIAGAGAVGGSIARELLEKPARGLAHRAQSEPFQHRRHPRRTGASATPARSACWSRCTSNSSTW